ncbi:MULTISPECIES: hypothetical protein [Lactococcus]|uniref:hypothetical protein n=1 Tax=Lactococcus TaxID=1357 RepID=UPI000230EA0B|nr:MULTISPECIES: hypothetical protein [Lactococcus]EHE91725.1 hypothetical protein LLCRE1631_02567 [Lactococcus lactis subsp. lactis CNCM I-1631]MCT4407675.1 hypothetical protein [Lactococcus cremoris]UPG97672.1 hypothetical protein MXM90_10895 [Lactococcus lactis]GEB09718.1 hypothetical protein LLA03_23030 [Lactococcus lactis subsp. lactis]
MNLTEFMEKYGEVIPDDNTKQCISTEFEKIEIDEKKKYLFNLNFAIRYYSKRSDIYTYSMEDIPLDEFTSGENFDSLLEEIDKIENETVHYPEWQKIIFFLPYYWEGKIKEITVSGKKSVDHRLKKYIPEDVVKKLNLDFVVERGNLGYVKSNKASTYGTSFFRFVDDDGRFITDNARLLDAANKINNLLNGTFIDSCYCLGTIPENIGLFLERLRKEPDDPKTYHYEFWKPASSCDMSSLTSNFEEIY